MKHCDNTGAFSGEKPQPLGSCFRIMTSLEHTFGSDSIFLADFSNPGSSCNLCDLCSGCGIVSVLWAAEDKKRRIDAIEIQNSAVRLIKKSIEMNSLSCINTVEADLRDLGRDFKGKYDLVACNPPFKKAGTGAVSREPSAAIAKHETLCTLEDIISVSSHILKNGGRLCLCHRPERLADIIYLMRLYKMEPKRLRFVQQSAQTNPWLVLIEGKKQAKPGLRVKAPLIVENRPGEYTEETQLIYTKLGEF